MRHFDGLDPGGCKQPERHGQTGTRRARVGNPAQVGELVTASSPPLPSIPGRASVDPGAISGESAGSRIAQDRRTRPPEG